MVEIFCIASGPSLTKADCDLVAASGAKVLAVNNSWEMFERCDYIYAGDLKWWNAYREKITVDAEMWTSSKQAAREFGIKFYLASGPFNSGMRAIQWAISHGYKTIGLIGYDCSLKYGSHWHGDHSFKGARKLEQLKVNKWKMQFAKVERQASHAGARIINCSRHTDLVCFPVATLEDVINAG